MASAPTQSLPANGGDGLYSYTRNSTFQKRGVEIAKALIKESIAEKFDANRFISPLAASTKLCIADLGCSVGPNAFIAVQNIIESLELKFSSAEAIEFQVFFNDFTSNDFNTLFRSLPCDRHYFATGVPGGFHDRLFPKASIHIIHCSYAVHWMSKVPKEVMDKDSPAWNKGRIDYAYGPPEVHEAYAAQFVKDVERFLRARAQELACGGLMALLVPCLSSGTTAQQCSIIAMAGVLGSCLVDMATEGLLSENDVDSFNLPRYYASQQELESVIERNGSFSIERIELLDRAKTDGGTMRVRAPSMIASSFRSILEGLIKEHFGAEIVDGLFSRFEKKMEESSVLSDPRYKSPSELFILLKRKVA